MQWETGNWYLFCKGMFNWEKQPICRNVFQYLLFSEVNSLLIALGNSACYFLS